MKRIALSIITLFVCVVCYGATFNQYWYVGSDSYATTSCTTGSDITLPTPPTKYGYDFIGWEKLPYVPIEYLESTGTVVPYIDTGIYPKDTLMIRVGVKPLSNSAIFGAYYSENKRFNAGFNEWVGAGLFLDYGQGNGYRRIHTQWSESEYYNLEFGNTYIKDLNTTNILAAGNYYNFAQFNLTIFLFIENGFTSQSYKSSQIYYLQIYDNNVLVRDFIPVLDPVGTPCMFDKVENKFYYNAGTGDFIAGPVIEE